MSKLYLGKTPAKKEGLNIHLELDGATYALTCLKTGKKHNNVETLAWYHENGEQAYRSINGKITFIEPSETDAKQTRAMPEVSTALVREFELRIERENYAHELAVNIAARRQPNMVGKDAMGAIVHATKMALLASKI